MAEVKQDKSTTVFYGVNPIFNVKSLQASIDHYVGVLGFKVDWSVPGIMASVSRNRCAIMLCEGDQGHPGTWVWIGVGDIEPLFEELVAKGAKIRNPPTNYEWAYEMQVEDPDGNVLRIGSDPKPDQPIGPFRDMHGVLWQRQADGSHRRVQG
jgi:predicted enzyme related to lactoylglutathione lyase